LVDTDEEVAILQAWDNETSGIDHSWKQKHRVFQYADTADIFKKCEVWRGTRFSDGTFGVWYGALDRSTSLLETYYWSIKVALPNLKAADGPVYVERAMYEAKVATERMCDLRPFVTLYPDLIHSSDYSLCQAVGRTAVLQSIDVLQSVSARDPGSVSVPVSTPEAILSDRKVGFHTFTIQTASDQIIGSIDDTVVTIPSSWGLVLPD
jgi:hypothetical protein